MWKIRVNENTCTLPNNRKLRETISNQPKISEDPRGRCRFKNRARAHARSRDPPPRDLRERNRGNSTVTDGNKKKKKGSKRCEDPSNEKQLQEPKTQGGLAEAVSLWAP